MLFYVIDDSVLSEAVDKQIYVCDSNHFNIDVDDDGGDFDFLTVIPPNTFNRQLTNNVG